MEIAFERVRGAEYRAALAKAEIVIAPDLFVSEVTNAFWKYQKFAEVSDDQCLSGIDFCLSLVDDLRSTKDLWHEVMKESIRFSHYAYDLFYLVLTRRLGGYIMSRDKKLLDVARQMGVDSV